MLCRGVIPAIAGCGLEVPSVSACIGIERNDTGEEKVVSAIRTSDLMVPMGAISYTDVNEIELGIEHNGVPNSSATTLLPP